MATIRDVARLAGVSISTVSLTLNDPVRVSPETARRVLAAARETGYSADPVAQSLKSGRTRLIGMVVLDIGNPFFSELLRGVERYAVERDYMVIVSDTAGDPERERAILEHLSAQRVAGVLLSSCGIYPEGVEHIRRLKMPCVLIDHMIEGIGSDFVGTDNLLASAMLTEHLIRLGHQRIALLGGIAGLYTSELRRQGFVDTLRGAGLEADPSLIVDGGYQGRTAYEQTMRLLTRPDRPTAILAAANVMALGALKAINDLNIRCPEEVSLAGIDDVPWSAVISPRITVAVQPIEELAEAAGRLVMERIAGRRPAFEPPFEHVVLPPALVIGGSTRAVR